jgi:hypothetical protein
VVDHAKAKNERGERRERLRIQAVAGHTDRTRRVRTMGYAEAE